LTQICHSNTLVNMMHHCNITQINHTSIWANMSILLISYY
jgi:hypothetical protein